MTLNEIRSSTKDILIPKDIAPLLGCHEHAIRLAARDGDLPFPVVLMGSRVKIPRVAFIRWFTGEAVRKGGDSGEA